MFIEACWDAWIVFAVGNMIVHEFDLRLTGELVSCMSYVEFVCLSGLSMFQLEGLSELIDRVQTFLAMSSDAAPLGAAAPSVSAPEATSTSTPTHVTEGTAPLTVPQAAGEVPPGTGEPRDETRGRSRTPRRDESFPEDDRKEESLPGEDLSLLGALPQHELLVGLTTAISALKTNAGSLGKLEKALHDLRAELRSSLQAVASALTAQSEQQKLTNTAQDYHTQKLQNLGKAMTKLDNCVSWFLAGKERLSDYITRLETSQSGLSAHLVLAMDSNKQDIVTALDRVNQTLTTVMDRLVPAMPAPSGGAGFPPPAPGIGVNEGATATPAGEPGSGSAGVPGVPMPNPASVPATSTTAEVPGVTSTPRRSPIQFQSNVRVVYPPGILPPPAPPVPATSATMAFATFAPMVSGQAPMDRALGGQVPNMKADRQIDCIEAAAGVRRTLSPTPYRASELTAVTAPWCPYGLASVIGEAVDTFHRIYA